MNISSLPVCFLNSTVPYSCNDPYPNCTNQASFQFSSLWIITQAIYNSCPNDTRLFNQGPFLTQEACEIFANGDAWTPYAAADIWVRLTTWKFPLLQLVAVFPRPPLSLLSELFVLVHLLGDPISTINNLLLKVASCQGRAEYWRDRFNDHELLGHLLRTDGQPGGDSVRRWKALAAIADSYDEWGPDKGTAAESFMLDRLTSPDVSHDDQKKFLEICRITGNALAADRSTKFLPITVAQCFFISTIAIAFGRTKDSATGPNPDTFINVEAHSVAFSSLYFWIIPAVLISSIIGVSQTEDAIPRILRRFSSDVHQAFPQWDMLLKNDHLTTPDGRDRKNTELRERSGGIYSWQPEESRQAVKQTINRAPYNPTPAHRRSFWRRLPRMMVRLITIGPCSETLPGIVFASGALTAITISLLVPPTGWECRHVGQLLIAATWILSAMLNYVPFGGSLKPRQRFMLILLKDVGSTALTMGGVVATQIGVFNRCSCYTLWGRVGLALPESGAVARVLLGRIDAAYPAIAFVCVSFQLVVVPLLVVRQYGLAIRVFLQRDDEASNLRWLPRRGPAALVGIWERVGGVVRRGRGGKSGRVVVPGRRRRPEVVQAAPGGLGRAHSAGSTVKDEV